MKAKPGEIGDSASGILKYEKMKEVFEEEINNAAKKQWLLVGAYVEIVWGAKTECIEELLSESKIWICDCPSDRHSSV